MTLKEFIKTKTFRINAIAALALTLFLILFAMFSLRIYTDHGDTISIPDLKGKNAEQATGTLNNLDLECQVRDSVYSRDAMPGTVVDQFPQAGTKVKKNRTVFISICALSQEMIHMPQLTDISYRQAVNIIESSGMVAGSIEYQPSEFANLVIDQKINGQSVQVGQLVPKGSVVDLVLGSDSNGETSEVPNLFGKSLADAKMIIGEAFLTVGTVTYDSITTDDQREKAMIWKQSPDPVELFEVTKGSSINLWLTTNPAKLAAKPKPEEPDNSFF